MRGTLGEILSGEFQPRERTDLEDGLRRLLDDAAANGGQLDPEGYWKFVADLARGRGIAKELETAAFAAVIKNEPPSDEPPGQFKPDDPSEFWRRCQAATLFHLLRRIAGDQKHILPESFRSFVWENIAWNLMGEKAGRMDLMRLNTAGGDERALRRTARAMLVLAVLYRKAREGIRENEARERVLPTPGHPRKDNIDGSGFDRTWRDWKADTAAFMGTSFEQLQEEAERAARGEIWWGPFDLQPNKVDELWNLARGG